MPKLTDSAGTLLCRHRDGVWQVLLVHPSGNYNRRAPWSIPKGVPDPGEQLEAAARRETFEETGIAAGHLHHLGFIDYKKSRKRVHGFAGEAPVQCEPTCASWEVDRAEFLPLPEARRLIHPDQAPLLDMLEQWLAEKAT